MGSFKTVFRWRWWGILLVIMTGTAVAAAVIIRKDDSANLSGIGPDMAMIQYRFHGEVMTHYLSGIASISEYRRPEEIDAVVFNLKAGDDYVVNADKLVNYTLAPNTTIEKVEKLNQLYYHYDPYLQGEKQGWHKEWAEAEYLKWVGRLPTEAEWLEVLNELTRRMEHPQMSRWIQYSPPAIRHFIETEYLAAFGRLPAGPELQQYYDRLLAGETYEQIREEITHARR